MGASRSLAALAVLASFCAGLVDLRLSDLRDAALLAAKASELGALGGRALAASPAAVVAAAAVAAALLCGSSPGEAIAYTVTHHRWVLACFLMPISFVFDGFWMLRSKLVFFMGSAPEKHDERVADVQEQVRAWAADPQGQKMCTARAGWLAMSLRVGKYKSTHRNIRIELRDVLEVDTDKRTVRVVRPSRPLRNFLHPPARQPADLSAAVPAGADGDDGPDLGDAGAARLDPRRPPRLPHTPPLP